MRRPGLTLAIATTTDPQQPLPRPLGPPLLLIGTAGFFGSIVQGAHVAPLRGGSNFSPIWDLPECLLSTQSRHSALRQSCRFIKRPRRALSRHSIGRGGQWEMRLRVPFRLRLGIHGRPAFSASADGANDGLGGLLTKISVKTELLRSPTRVLSWHHLLFANVTNSACLGSFAAAVWRIPAARMKKALQARRSFARRIISRDPI